ncbi:hypothetical protein JCM5350_007997 [Sporobolomyces pararoseus]
MPYARRSRVHQLTARQLQHLNALQRSSIPHSVAVTASSSSSPSTRSAHSHHNPLLQNASIKSNSKLNGNAQVFNPDSVSSTVVESVQLEGERVTSTDSSRRADENGSAETKEVGIQTKVMPGEEAQMVDVRPCSKRSDSQTEFQIVQRGTQGNLVFISNESSTSSSQSTSPSNVQRSSIHVSQHLTEDCREEEWELLSYEEEEEEETEREHFRNERKGINLASRLVSALA